MNSSEINYLYIKIERREQLRKEKDRKDKEDASNGKLECEHGSTE